MGYIQIRVFQRYLQEAIADLSYSDGELTEDGYGLALQRARYDSGKGKEENYFWKGDNKRNNSGGEFTGENDAELLIETDDDDDNNDNNNNGDDNNNVDDDDDYGVPYYSTTYIFAHIDRGQICLAKIS